MGEVFTLNNLHVVTERQAVSTRPFLFLFADMEGTAGVLTLSLIKKPALRKPRRREAERTGCAAGAALPISPLTGLSRQLQLFAPREFRVSEKDIIKYHDMWLETAAMSISDIC